MKEDAPNDLTIFNVALEISAPAERAAYIDQACSADTALWEKIVSLLAAHENGADSFDGLGGAAASRIRAVAAASEQPGTVIGRYKLREKIGEGGCGVVHVAEQEQPVCRKVALKILKLGMDNRLLLANEGVGTNVITYLGTPGANYALDLATNLAPAVNWILQRTNTASTANAATAGYLMFTNSNHLRQAYYRTRQVP
jgi:hypothetical protein